MDLQENVEMEPPYTNEDIFDQDTIDEIMKMKASQPNKFQSYWEKDEEDIEAWSQVSFFIAAFKLVNLFIYLRFKDEIALDPGKQLLTFAENGDLEPIEKLLKLHMDLVKYQDSDGYTALHRAAYSNKLDVVKYLLDFGFDIEARTSMGWTPLHSAAYWNNYEVVEYLVARDADVNAKTNSGQTALHLSGSQKNSKETLMILLSNSFTDYRILNDNGESAEQIASRSCEFYRLFEIADINLNQI